MKKIKIGLLGMGTVGSGVWNILKKIMETKYLETVDMKLK